MSPDTLITLAIHTYSQALVLKSILENEGIPVVLQNVNLVQPVVSSGVRVRIHEANLPQALRIVENIDLIGGHSHNEGERPVGNGCILVPVDFSDYSHMACRTAFTYASMTGAEVKVLHCYIPPSFVSSFQLSDALDFDFEELSTSADNAPSSEGIETEARRNLDDYAVKLRRMIETGELPAVRFTTALVDDIAEEAIVKCAKELMPRLIVMGTRGIGRREQDMVGSVTAEVLDTARFPVLTIPSRKCDCDELLPLTDGHVAFLCNYEQTDLVALDLLYRLFHGSSLDVTLVALPAKKRPLDIERMDEALLAYCREHCPGFRFRMAALDSGDAEADFRSIDAERHVDLIAVPNKRRNMLSRIFNPGLAHRMLFHADIPMVVLPV